MSSSVEVQIYKGGGKLLDELQDFLLPITISWQGYYLLNIEAASWILTALRLNSTLKKGQRNYAELEKKPFAVAGILLTAFTSECMHAYGKKENKPLFWRGMGYTQFPFNKA